MTFAALATLLLAGDPELDWKTLETAHFRVHYHVAPGEALAATAAGEAAPPPGERFARQVANRAEEALGRLGPALDAAPFDLPVHLVCTDLADGANGLAGTLPYDRITLNAFAPEADTELATADDWIRQLVVHELTHILHLDRIAGFWTAVNTVFGKTYLPNHVLPQWFIEGLAVYAESRLAGSTAPSGRVGSAPTESVLRTAALEGTLPTTLGGFTTNPALPPGGGWAYAFGGDFMAWIASRHGPEGFARFIGRYGTMLPFGLNTAAREAFGADFPTLFAEWRQDRVARAQAFVAARPLAAGVRLTQGGSSHHTPAFAPDGSLWVSQTDGHGPERLVRYPVPGAPGEALPRHAVATGALLEPLAITKCDGGCGHLAPLPGGGTLMASGGWADPHRFHRDLFVLGRESERERVTRGLRAREPDVDPAGREAVFVAASWGRTALMAVDLARHTTRTLVPFDADLWLHQPRILPDGRVVVSAQHTGGTRDLFAVPLRGGPVQRLTENPEREIAPARHPDGRHLVVAMDVDPGVRDLWALDLVAGTRRRLTRLHGGALNPTVSPDGHTVVYEGWHATGWDLYAVPFDAEANPTGAGAEPTPRVPEPPPRGAPEVAATVRPYNPFASAWPRTWAPMLRSTPNALTVNLLFTAQDAAERHLATAVIDWNTTDMTVSAAASYAYGGVRPRLSASIARWPGVGYRYVADRFSTFPMENLYVTAGLDVGVPDLVDPFDLGFDVAAWWTFAPDPPSLAEGHDPGEDVPFQSRDDRALSLRFRWSYNRTERYLYAISTSLGVRLSMDFEVWPAPLGNDATTWALGWSAEGFVPFPWLRGHVGALSLHGGVRGGAVGSRGRYAVGGFPEQDIVQDLLNRAALVGTYLRGFAPGAFSGEVFVQGSAEYRFPIVDIYRGPGTLPVAFERLAGAVWSDWALVYDDAPTAQNVAASVGLELVATAQMLYGIPSTFRLGWAAPVTWPYGGGPYFVMGSSF